MYWVDYFILIFAVLLIVVVLLQQSGDDAAEAFSGGNSDQKGKSLAGFDRFLTITGGALILLIFVFVLISHNLHG